MFRPAVLIRPVALILSAFLIVALVSAAAPAYAQGTGPDHPQAGKGSAPEHGSLSAFPFEQIDAYTGNAVLRFDDLVMSSSTGFNVVVSRTYNTKAGGWRWGVGPTMIMPINELGGDFPRLLQPDGTEVRLHRIGTGVYLSPSFDRYTSAARTLEMASGIVAHFDERGQLHHMVDPFGNVVNVVIDDLYRLKRVEQNLGNEQVRVAELQYDEAGGGVLPLSLTCQGRTWSYGWETVAGAVRLTQVTPPEGPVWTFGYGLEAHENPTRLEHTLTVTMPTGGQVQYLSWEGRWQIANELHALDWPTGIPKLYQRRVSAAANLGSPDDLWTFDYIDNGRTTYVTGTTPVGPPGQQVPFSATFTHYPGGNPAGAYDPEQPYPAVLLVGSSGTGRDLTTVIWQEGAYLGTPEQHDPNPPETDPRTFVPASVIRTRDGRDYTTTYSYGGTSLNAAHFNQPVSVTESGDFTRTTTYEYEVFDGAPYMADRVSSETVSSGSEDRVSTFAYDANTGFLLSKTVLGVQTTFAPDGFGNVASITDASGHTTATTYEWGVPKQTTTPEFVISRAINPTGTVASETRQGQTMAWQYDHLGRVTQMTPRVGASTSTDYDTTNGRTVTVSRGAWH